MCADCLEGSGWMEMWLCGKLNVQTVRSIVIEIISSATKITDRANLFCVQLVYMHSVDYKEEEKGEKQRSMRKSVQDNAEQHGKSKYTHNSTDQRNI